MMSAKIECERRSENKKSFDCIHAQWCELCNAAVCCVEWIELRCHFTISNVIAVYWKAELKERRGYEGWDRDRWGNPWRCNISNAARMLHLSLNPLNNFSWPFTWVDVYALLVLKIKCLPALYIFPLQLGSHLLCLTAFVWGSEAYC